MPTKPNKLDGSNLRKFKTFDKTHFSSLIFPSDLEDQQYYPECIKFGIYERTGLDFERFGEAISSSISDTLRRASLASDDEQIRALQEQIDERSEKIAELENIERGQATLSQRQELQALRENDERAREEQQRINPTNFLHQVIP